ncbi:MAG: acyl carrier protein [Fibrobacteraceae bacterium]|nr:acyl carrier protein [Fibrobacteraceae bacterium]
MDIKEFILKFAEEIEIENQEDLTPDTVFRDLEEWSSLSVMVFIAFADENFGKQIGDKQIAECNTIQDLYNLMKA